ncbi:MAG TPA: glycine/sarcosine/betaine reductase selenoprotein B family protein [Blastocatellia bacterium]|nr:glycine/sarcosine/betaine reductase selenoprotein B family protein [Blastocatellia bacterium]
MYSQSVSTTTGGLADANFVEVEKQFIRERGYPDFDWVSYGTPSPVNRLTKPLPECRVAMVTTAGAHLKTDLPFNLRSRIGDHTYREIPNEANLNDLVLSHVGYNIVRVSEDKNCVFPLDRLRELESEGIIGALATRHYSFMGYIAVTEPLINETAPEVAEKLKADEVDLVLLAPA